MVPVQDNTWEFCSRDYAQAGSLVGTPAAVSGYPATNLIDGDRQTQWRYGSATPVAVTFDLGAVETVGRIFVRAPFGYSVGTLTVELSDDDVTYVAAAGSFYGSLIAGVCKLTGVVTARFVRVTFTPATADYRLCQVEIFRAHAVCDGYTGSHGSQMPFNPAGFGGSRSGRVLVPLMHGSNSRAQSWGCEREEMQVTFPQVLRGFLDLLRYFEERGKAFGLLTHEFVFHSVIVLPNGLTWTEVESDGPGAYIVAEDRTEASKTWYLVELRVREVADFSAINDEEPVIVDESVVVTESVGV